MSFSGDLYPEAGATSVLTTKGDLVRYDSQRERYGIGSANQILQVKSNLPSWETVPLADTVLTTAGDILYENATPELARLAIASNGDVLTLTAGLPSWVTPAAGGGKAFFTTMQDNQSTTATRYYAINSQDFASATSGSMEMEIQTAVTLSNMAWHIDYNTKAADQDCGMYDDGATIGTVTITSSGTGYFDSGAISVSVAAGSLIGFIYLFTQSGLTIIRPALMQLDT